MQQQNKNINGVNFFSTRYGEIEQNERGEKNVNWNWSIEDCLKSELLRRSARVDQMSPPEELHLA